MAKDSQLAPIQSVAEPDCTGTTSWIMTFALSVEDSQSTISAQGRTLSTGNLLALCSITAMSGHFVKLVTYINEFC